MTMKRIMRYLKGTDDFGLYYKRSEKFELNSNTNANWEGKINDRKSTSGGALFLGKDKSLGVARRKVVPHSPQLKLSMLQLPSIVPTLYGSSTYRKE